MKLKGKIALITGAGRGIGRAHALRLASLGADIVINDIDLDSHKEFNETITAPTVMDEVRALGVQCIGLQTDVTQKGEVDAMIESIIDRFGSIDILINNAGGLAGDVMQSFAASVNQADLMATINREDFGQKTLQERKAYFYAVAKIAGDNFVPFLQNILESRAWFRRTDVEAQYQLAAYGLTVIGSGKAREVLQRCTKSKNKSRSPCTRRTLSFLSSMCVRA